MQLGLVGLGRMGGNMRERLRARRARGGRVRPQPGGLRRRQPRASWSSKLAAAAGRLGDGAGRRSPRRPSTSSAGLLSAGDIIIDGGNSRFTDDGPRAERLATSGIGYVDVGVSGGVWGLDERVRA